jgi:hypothetical protein
MGTWTTVFCFFFFNFHQKDLLTQSSGVYRRFYESYEKGKQAKIQ